MFTIENMHGDDDVIYKMKEPVLDKDTFNEIADDLETHHPGAGR